VNESGVTGGTWNPLFSGSTISIEDTAITLYQTKIISPAFNVEPSNHIGEILYVSASGGYTLTLDYNGTSQGSFIITPLVTLHNDLAGLQGGSQSERYHLDLGQVAVVNATSGVNTGDETKATIESKLTGTITTHTHPYSGLTGKPNLSLYQSVSGFTAYTATTETRFQGIENDITYISGVTDTKLNINTFTGYTATTEAKFNSYTGTTQPILDAALTGATNGLSKSGRNVKLGGTLSEATTISGNSLNLCFGDVGSSLNTFAVNSVNINLEPTDFMVNATNEAQIIGGDFTIALSGSTGTITDSNSVGLKYGGDYSGNYTCLSIPNAGWVTGQTGAVGAANGLTKVGNNIVLGGVMSANTVISGATRDLYFGNTASKFNVLCVNAQNTFETCAPYTRICAVDELTLSSLSGSQSITMQSGLDGIFVNDSTNSRGLIYNGTYKANFLCHSLVDVDYVTGITAALVADIAYISGVTDTNSADIISLSAITVTNSADIISLSAITVTNSADIAYISGVTATNTADIISLSAITVTNSADIISLSAITVTNTADIAYISGVTDTKLATSIFNSYTGITQPILNAAMTGATNGLTSSSKIVKLGGVLTENTTISGNTKILCIGTPTNVLNSFNVNACVASTNSVSNLGNSASMTITAAGLNSLSVYAGSQAGINIEYGCITYKVTGANCKMVVQGGTGFSGMTYAGAYRSNFTPLSLVDKCYVDLCVGSIPSGVQTANNGLTKDGTNVRLGGTLTGSTSISGAQTLNFNISALNITGNTAIKSSTLTLDTVSAGTVSNPIMVLDSGVVKCVPASNYNVTAVNGLTATGNEVKLGGALTGNTEICIGTNVLDIYGSNAGVTPSFQLDGTQNSATINGGGAIADFRSNAVTLKPKSVGSDCFSVGLSYASYLSTGGTGIRYAGDYESTLVDRSLVTKKYVTSQVSGITGTVTSVTASTTTTGTDITVSVANPTTTPVITLCIPTASAANRGALSSTDWGTFNAKTTCVGTVTSVAALTISNAGTDIASSVANSGTTPVITLCIPTASAANRGALSSTDWSTFNAKTTCTGTVTGANNGLCATSTTVSLGGILTGNTTINTDGNNFCVCADGAGRQIYIGSSDARMSYSGASGTGNLIISPTSASLTSQNGTCVAGISAQHALNTIYFNAAGNSKTCHTVTGFEYCGNYCASRKTDPRWIPDNAYVTGYTQNAIIENSNTVKVNNVTTNYNALCTDDFIGVSGASEICLPSSPKPCQRIIVSDICGQALSANIRIFGCGMCINGNDYATINTDYGAMTFINNGSSWSAVAFIN